jgi:hypothetical protein
MERECLRPMVHKCVSNHTITSAYAICGRAVALPFLVTLRIIPGHKLCPKCLKVKVSTNLNGRLFANTSLANDRDTDCERKMREEEEDHSCIHTDLLARLPHHVQDVSLAFHCP